MPYNTHSGNSDGNVKEIFGKMLCFQYIEVVFLLIILDQFINGGDGSWTQYKHE